MNAVTLDEAKDDLERLVQQVIANAEPTILSAENGDKVVLLALDEFNSLIETVYLLGNPSNAAHLRQSISEVHSGVVTEKELYDA